jgi:hypothetical protein
MVGHNGVGAGPTILKGILLLPLPTGACYVEVGGGQAPIILRSAPQDSPTLYFSGPILFLSLSLSLSILG